MKHLDTAERRRRLVRRHHLDRTAADARTATGDLVCLHASDPLTPHLALWARVPAYAPGDLDRALVEDHSLWRLHAMRRTLWVVPSEQAGDFDAAAGQQIAASERKRLTGWAAAERAGAEAWLERLEAELLEVVRAQPGIGTRALNKALPELATKVTLGSGKWSTRAAIGSRLLFVLAMELKLARGVPAGSWRSSQYGWFDADVWPARTAPPPAQARARLLGRYLARFGPITTTDAKWWTGWTLARTRAALADAGAVAVTLDDGEGWVAPEDSGDTPDTPSAALLPGLDPTPMGFKERSWFLGAHGAALFDRNGNIGPTAWAGGRIVGGWAVGADGGVRLRLLEDPGPAGEALSREVEGLERWLGGVSITPRFRTPLEKELAR